mmetsp:Transcript_5843/g.15558  ORF Transcript_5843/g.15558 Transcript_5843/m.15558 type:complete len:273 (+) Transcript_5843:683-1501(+)
MWCAQCTPGQSRLLPCSPPARTTALSCSVNTHTAWGTPQATSVTTGSSLSLPRAVRVASSGIGRTSAWKLCGRRNCKARRKRQRRQVEVHANASEGAAKAELPRQRSRLAPSSLAGAPRWLWQPQKSSWQSKQRQSQLPRLRARPRQSQLPRRVVAGASGAQLRQRRRRSKRRRCRHRSRKRTRPRRCGRFGRTAVMLSPHILTQPTMHLMMASSAATVWLHQIAHPTQPCMRSRLCWPPSRLHWLKVQQLMAPCRSGCTTSMTCWTRSICS